MVRPPMAVAASGTRSSTHRATSKMPSGRQAVCFESRKYGLRLPDLSVKSPRLTECFSKWSTSCCFSDASGKAHLLAAVDDFAHLRRAAMTRGAQHVESLVGVARRHGHDHAQPEVERRGHLGVGD